MRDWAIHWRSAEIYGTRATIHICEVPWWAVGIEHLIIWIDVYIFRHRWCEPWEWTFKIPTKSFHRDEDGFLDHSIGSALFGSFQWAACVTWRHETNNMQVSVTDEWLEENGQGDPFEEMTA